MATTTTEHAEGLPTRLVGVWAHPDDEAYLSAGLMGRVADAGHHVTVVTCTPGEKGTADPADYDRKHFGRRRQQELRASLATVGVHDLRALGFRDGECDLVPDEAAVAAIAAVLQEMQPDMVVTFGPDGITGHPDHRAVSRWTTEAWRRTGHGRLRYATMTAAFVERHRARHERIGLFDGAGPAGPVWTPAEQIALAVHLTGPELDRKRAALARHASQTDALATLMGEAAFRTWWHTEWFRPPTTAEVAAVPAASSALTGSPTLAEARR